MSWSPRQTCKVCHRFVIVKVGDDSRGFPPEMARAELAKMCTDSGHISVPQYSAGVA